VPSTGRFIYQYTLVSSAVSTWIVISMFLRARRNRDAAVLPQYRALLVAILGGLVLPTIWNVARLLGGLFPDRWIVHLNVAPVLLYPAFTGYALVRHNLFSVDRFTSAVVGHAVSAASLAVGFALALIGVPLLLGRLGLARSPELLVGTTAVAFAALLPVYRALKRKIDQGFQREQVSAARLTEELGELGRVVQLGDRERSLTTALAALRVLQGERAELWSIAENGSAFVLSRADGVPREAGDPAKLARTGPLAQALLSGRAGGVQGLAASPYEERAAAELWGLELVMAAPVSAHGVVAGFLGVGRKRSGTAFGAEELSFLGAVATQVGIARERQTGESAQLGRYRIEKRLGVGGMAEVFLAWQVGVGGFERKVALKRPLPQLMEDPSAVAMFLDEARIAAQLQHRHIVQLFEVDRHEGTYFIAMEYVDGPTLRTCLRAAAVKEMPVPLGVVAAIGGAVLSALAHAHALEDAAGRPLKLVHRDVTPGNVLLSRAGDVKLVDFGIARSASRLQVTSTGVVKGTLAYMSPEQAAGQPVDARADLFSVGATLYELATGERPFPDGVLGQSPDLKPPSEWRAELPKAFDAVVLRALAFTPGERYASAEAMREALLSAIAPADEVAVARWHRGLVADSGVTGEDVTRVGV
jgi:hypothetical protein